eukprot:CAMPEP_0185621200 /NCGR_PEP_ID=MMETSP0436-20130131/56495_1 /TAXON_ID=626734 ORGANISM="Favella taraikaensis, Strain Fe Narragansett Bay" /NCGR_SAMPLE_ID=MMETSP0436 /ASSEMBLY_ACC=CAM_ASM_000390 /LENGTH=70 /DNA_ID=CAMNT_0028262221 /DNA_START=482 /DNA_END=694 /DNA_ORIENTATION=-
MTIGYTANGEASDWMLHELGIFALSPELGISNKSAETFFIRDQFTLAQTITTNFKWIESAMKLLFESVEC